MNQIDTGLQLEQLHTQMVVRTVTRRAIVELAWTGFGVSNELLNIIGWKTLMHHQSQAGRAHIGDGLQIFDDVEGQLGVEVRARQRGGRTHHQGMAIGRRLGYSIGSNGAGCAGSVFHYHRQVPFQSELGGQEPGQNVRASAGRKGHQQFNGALVSHLGPCHRAGS